MELYQLRYFARAAAYENISMAAQDLHVTQPSISKAVKALEKELQVELMRRNGKYCDGTVHTGSGCGWGTYDLTAAAAPVYIMALPYFHVSYVAAAT